MPFQLRRSGRVGLAPPSGCAAARLRDFGQECLKRRRMRCRRLRTSTTYPKRTPGDLRTANRQGSIDAAVMAGPSISRIKKNIFFAPQ